MTADRFQVDNQETKDFLNNVGCGFCLASARTSVITAGELKITQMSLVTGYLKVHLIGVK